MRRVFIVFAVCFAVSFYTMYVVDYFRVEICKASYDTQMAMFRYGAICER